MSIGHLLVGVAVAAAPTGLQPNIEARGASKARVRVERADSGLSLTLENVAVGEYLVLRGPRCPLSGQPAEIRSGRVPPDRNGQDPEHLPFDTVQLGELRVTDKTMTTTMTLPSSASGEMNYVMLRERVPASPSLSDRFGLVACGRLPRNR